METFRTNLKATPPTKNKTTASSGTNKKKTVFYDTTRNAVIITGVHTFQN